MSFLVQFQAELSCSHERAMSDLREEHAREIQAMKDRHREEMAPGSRDAADGDRPHVNGHSNDVETVKEELMKEREQLEKSWEAERESLNEKITKLEGDMERVKEGHLAELEGIKISIQVRELKGELWIFIVNNFQIVPVFLYFREFFIGCDSNFLKDRHPP